MIRGIGIDLVEISRMESAYRRHGDRLVRRICTPSEAEVVKRDRHPVANLAIRFGVKEAVLKALGTGLRGVGWKEIETTAPRAGAVGALLTERALAVARRNGATEYCWSVTLSNDVALATVLLSGDAGAE